MTSGAAAPIDRYVVLEHLSEGGMGAIYVGRKMGAAGFEMEVVLKQLLPEFTQQAEFIDLFLREAKLSATLDHANIIHTIDLVTAGGEYFIVMEYLAGGDLRTLIKRAKRRGKRFSPAAAIFICRETLSALAYAHAKRDPVGQPLRLIHRDVSPSNILLSRAGEVKLTDFGIAKASTHTSLFYKVKGKVGYMSPEQAKSEQLDHRADLYSLAVCLYEVLTGERLFVHAGITTSADEIYSQPVPAVSRKIPGLAPEMDAIMAKALSISPAARYQTAGEFQEALARFAHRNGLWMSATELAGELIDVCGAPEHWRDEEDLGAPRRGGTEVYDAAQDGDDEDDDFGDLDHADHAVSAAGSSGGHDLRAASSLRMRARSEASKFAGVELTSIINNMISADGTPMNDWSSGPMETAPTQMPESTPFASTDLLTEDVDPLPFRDSLVSIATPTPTPAAHIAAAAPTITTPATAATPTPTAPMGWLRPWMIVVLVLAIAGIVAGAIAMSGPSVATRPAPHG